MNLPAVNHSPPDFQSRRVGVLGAARSGIGCARLLTSAGASVIVGDRKRAADLNARQLSDIAKAGAILRPELAHLDGFGHIDLLVISPGVPIDAPVVVQAREAGIRVTGEVEVASQFSRSPVIAITGTNAKGSTCTLAGMMLNASGVKARVCGNIGDPFTGAVADGTVPDVYVVEISSFQLETVETFRPRIATLLNVTPDHIDRHHTLAAYHAAKARIFENQTSDDWAIVNADDPVAVDAAQATNARRVGFSTTQGATEARVEGDALLVDIGAGPRQVCQTSDMVRQGRPYIETVLAASSAALIAGASAEGILSAIRAHELPEHVLEVVCEANGVTFIDSSKATNPAAAIADIESVEGTLVVIAGGLDKRVDFAPFAETLRKRARAVVVLGECADQIADAARGMSIVRCFSLEEAVQAAYEAAQPGDTVMLAPACASWDMFPSYKDRGKLFAHCAMQIAGPTKGDA